MTAVNLGGATLHAFAGIRDGRGPVSRLVSRVRNDPAAMARWRACTLLIIDEVSMLDADLLFRHRTRRCRRHVSVPGARR